MSVGAHLLRYKPEQIYCCWDCETEHLNLSFARPWQVAWIVFRDNEILERGNYFLKWPNLNISADAARISHFNEDRYKEKARDPREILPLFEAHLYNPEIRTVGHNLIFDGYMHRNWRRELEISEDWSWAPRHIDTNVLAKAWKKGWKPTTPYEEWQWRVADYREKGLKTALGAVAKDLGIEFNDAKAHDAEYDVFANMMVFNRLKWEVEI